MKPIVLPKIQSHNVQFLQSVFGKQVSIEVPLLSRIWRLRFLPASRLTEPGCHVALQVNSFAFTLCLDKQLFRLADEKLGNFRLDNLPEDLQPVFAEAVLMAALEFFEKTTGYYCSPAEIEFGETLTTKEFGQENFILPFLLIDESNATIAGELLVPENAIEFFSQVLDTLPAALPRQLASLPVSLAFIFSGTFSAGEVSAMARGDIFFPDIGGAADGWEIGILAGQSPCLRGKYNSTDSTVTVIGWNTIMDDQKSESIPVEQEQHLDKIQVPLLFEVGNTTISLAQLKTIQPGFVFELGTNAGKPVTIKSGSTTIGRGELVDIEGRTGVRILEVDMDGKL